MDAAALAGTLLALPLCLTLHPPGSSRPGGGGSLTELAALAPSDPGSEDEFGYDVAIAASVAVSGAPHHDHGGFTDNGAAYVFERDAGGPDAWNETVELVASDTGPLAAFGFSVAVDAETIVVGAPNADGFRGAVYVFERGRGGSGAFVETAKLVSSDLAQGDSLGFSVAIAGDTLVAGAPLHDPAGLVSAGAAYVFERGSGQAGWTEVAKLVADQALLGDDFGYAVDVSGDAIVVGALFDDGAFPNAGTAFVFGRDVGGPDAWGQTQQLFARDAALADFFGAAVAIDGSRLVIGAYGKSQLGLVQTGAAYVFEHRAADAPWVEVARLTANDAAAGDRLGKSVAIFGNHVLAGAPEDDLAQHGVNAGSVYLFARGDAGRWTQAQKVLSGTPGTVHQFGSSVASSRGRVVIGESGAFQSGLLRPGAAHVLSW